MIVFTNKEYTKGESYPIDGSLYLIEECIKHSDDKFELVLSDEETVIEEEITVTIGDKIFYADDKSLNRINAALTVASINNLTEHEWRLHPTSPAGKVAIVSIGELTAALSLGMQQLGERVLSK